MKIAHKILKIFKNFNKKLNMAENDVELKKQVTLGENTIIQFKLKTFIATIISILGILVSFYFSVVVPRAKDTENYQKELFLEYRNYVSNEFKSLNTAIQINTATVDSLAKKVETLDEKIKINEYKFPKNTITTNSPHITETNTAFVLNDNHQ